jgi:dipeptidyl aminopeptidase/acylaminoacyl peptidase
MKNKQLSSWIALIVLVILLLLVLASCTNTATPPSAQVAATSTPASTPTSHATFTPRPTRTPKPLTPTPSDTPLPTPTPTSTPQPTRQATATNPAAPGVTGKLVFQVATGGDIYIVNVDGTGLRRLTDGLEPALSPDGKQIAFARWHDPKGLYVLDLATGTERRIFAGEGVKSPSWSPDGKSIAFGQRTYRSTPTPAPTATPLPPPTPVPPCGYDWQHGRLVTLPPPGPGTMPPPCYFTPTITPPPTPTWTPIPTLSWEFYEQWQLRSVDVNTGVVTDWPVIVSYAMQPTWSADGKRLAYFGPSGISVTDIAGPPQQISPDSRDSLPVWSPDGSRIAFMYKQHDHLEIYVMTAEGKNRQRLTESPFISERLINSVSPAWSPDSHYIAYLSDKDGKWAIYVMRADGSDQRPLFPGGLPGIAIRYDFQGERVLWWGK